MKSVIFVNFNAFTFIYEGFSEFHQQHLCGFCCLLRVTLQHLTVLKFQMYYSTDFLVCISTAPRNNVCECGPVNFA